MLTDLCVCVITERDSVAVWSTRVACEQNVMSCLYLFHGQDYFSVYRGIYLKGNSYCPPHTATGNVSFISQYFSTSCKK